MHLFNKMVKGSKTSMYEFYQLLFKCRRDLKKNVSMIDVDVERETTTADNFIMRTLGDGLALHLQQVQI